MPLSELGCWDRRQTSLSGALYHGLDADYGPGGTYDECFDGAPRPDVVVAMAGCHSRYGFPGQLGERGNPEVDIVLVSGADDEECPIKQSDLAAERLSDKGYSVRRIDIPDANHAEFIIRDADSNWQTVPVDHPTSEEVVAIILDAIEAGQQKD